MADDSNRYIHGDFISSPTQDEKAAAQTVGNEQASNIQDHGVLCPDKDLNQVSLYCLPHTIAQNVTIFQDSKGAAADKGEKEIAAGVNIPYDDSLDDEDEPVFAQSNTDCVNFSLQSNVSSEEQSSLHIEGEDSEELNETNETATKDRGAGDTKVQETATLPVVGTSSPIADDCNDILFKIEDIRTIDSEIFKDAQANTDAHADGQVPEESKQSSSENIEHIRNSKVDGESLNDISAEGEVSFPVLKSKNKQGMENCLESCSSSNTDHSVFTEADFSETLVYVTSGDFSEKSDDSQSQTNESHDVATKNDPRSQEKLDAVTKVHDALTNGPPQSQAKNSTDDPQTSDDPQCQNKVSLPTTAKNDPQPQEMYDPAALGGLQTKETNESDAKNHQQSQAHGPAARPDPITKYSPQSNIIDDPAVNDSLQKSIRTSMDPDPVIDNDPKSKKSEISTSEALDSREEFSKSSNRLVTDPSNTDSLSPNDGADSSFSSISQMERMEVSTPESSSNSSFDKSTETDLVKDLQCSSTYSDFTSSYTKTNEAVVKSTQESSVTIPAILNESTERQIPLNLPANNMTPESELSVTSEVDFTNELLKDVSKSSSSIDQLDEVKAATSSTSVVFGTKDTHPVRQVDMSTDLQNSSIEESSSFEDNRLFIDEDKMSSEECSEKLKQSTEEREITCPKETLAVMMPQEKSLVPNFGKEDLSSPNERGDVVVNPEDFSTFKSATPRDTSDFPPKDEAQSQSSDPVADKNSIACKVTCEDAASLVTASQGFSLNDDIDASADEADNPHVLKQYGSFESDSTIVTNAAIIQHKANDSRLPPKNVLPTNNEDLLEKTSTGTTDDPEKTPKESKRSKAKERRPSGNQRKSSNVLNEEDESSSEDEDDDQNTGLCKDFEIVHKKGTNRFACSCGFADDEQYFATHLVLNHLIYKPFRCAYCKRCLLNKNYMKNHIREKHREEGKKPLLKEWSLVGLKKAENLCQSARKYGCIVHNAKKKMAEAEAAKYSSTLEPDIIRRKHASEPTLIQPKPLAERSQSTELPVLKFTPRSARQASIDVDKSKPLQDTVVPSPPSFVQDANRTNSKARHSSDSKSYSESEMRKQNAPSNTCITKKNSITSGIIQNNESSPKSPPFFPSRLVLISPEGQVFPIQNFNLPALNQSQGSKLPTITPNPSYGNQHLPVPTSQEFQSNAVQPMPAAVHGQRFPVSWLPNSIPSHSQVNQILPSEEQIVPVMQSQNKSRDQVVTTSTVSYQRDFIRPTYQQTSVPCQNFSTIPPGMIPPRNLLAVNSYQSGCVPRQQQIVPDRPNVFPTFSNISSPRHSFTMNTYQAPMVVQLLTTAQQSRNPNGTVLYQQSQMVNQLSAGPRNTHEAAITTASDTQIMRNLPLTRDLLSNCPAPSTSQNMKQLPSCIPTSLNQHVPKGITVIANQAPMNDHMSVAISQTSKNSNSDLPTQNALKAVNIWEKALEIRDDPEPTIRTLLTAGTFRFTEGVYQCLEDKKNWKSRENFWWHLWRHLHLVQAEKRFCTDCYNVHSSNPKCRGVDKLLMKIEENHGEKPPEINPKHNKEAMRANDQATGSNNQINTLFKVEASAVNRFESNDVTTAILIDSDEEPNTDVQDSRHMDGTDSVEVAVEKLKAFIAQIKTLEAAHGVCSSDNIEQRRAHALKIKSTFERYEKREGELENRPPKTEEEMNCDRLKILRSIQVRLLKQSKTSISQQEENARNLAKLRILKEVTKVFGNDLNSTTSDASEQIHRVSKSASKSASTVTSVNDPDAGQISGSKPNEPNTNSSSSPTGSGTVRASSVVTSDITIPNESGTIRTSSVITSDKAIPNESCSVRASSVVTSDRTIPNESCSVRASSVITSDETINETLRVHASSVVESDRTTLNRSGIAMPSSVASRDETTNETLAAHASAVVTSDETVPNNTSTSRASSAVTSGRTTPNEPGSASSIVPKSSTTEGPAQFFSCSLCRFSTLFALKFKKHLDDHAGQDLLCTHCGYSSDNVEEFFKHFRGHSKTNPGLATFVCVWKSCNKFQCNKLAEFMHHLKMHRSKADLTCCCCDSVYQSLDLFRAHLQSSLMTIVKCPHCHAKATDKKSMLQHIANYHPNKGRMISITKHLICDDRKLHGYDPLKMLTLQTEWLNQDEGDDDDVEFIEYIEAPPRRSTSRPGPLEVKKEMVSQESSSSRTRNLSDSLNQDSAKEATVMATATTASTTTNQLASRYPDPAPKAPSTSEHEIVHDSSLGLTHFQLPSSSLSSFEEPVSESIPDHLKYRCPQCSFVAERTSTLDDHLYKHRNLHQIDDEKDFSCMFCPTTFNDLTEIENHLQHHDEKISFIMYECTLDGFKTNQLHCLKAHVKDDMHQNHSNLNDMIRTSTIMLETKVTKCSKCDYKGFGKAAVMKHEKIHEAPKMVPEEIARSQFGKASEMKPEIGNDTRKTTQEEQFGKASEMKTGTIPEATRTPKEDSAVAQQLGKAPVIKYEIVYEEPKIAQEEVSNPEDFGKTSVMKHEMVHVTSNSPPQLERTSVKTEEIIDNAPKTAPVTIAPQPLKSTHDKSKSTSPRSKSSKTACSTSGKDNSHQPTVMPDMVSESYEDIHCVYKVTMGTSADRGTYFDQFDERISKMYFSKDRLYHCRLCEKTCKMKRAIHDHLGRHLDIPYLCEICDYEDKVFSLLKSHLKDVHDIDNVRVIFPKNWVKIIDKLLKPDGSQAIGNTVAEKVDSKLTKRRFFVKGSKGIQTWTVDAKASNDASDPKKYEDESANDVSYSENRGTVENLVDLPEISPPTRNKTRCKLKRKRSNENPTLQSKEDCDASSAIEIKRKKKSAVSGNQVPNIDIEEQPSSRDSCVSRNPKFEDTKKRKDKNIRHSSSTGAQSTKHLSSDFGATSSTPNSSSKDALNSEKTDNFHLIQELCADVETKNTSPNPIPKTEVKSHTNIEPCENSGAQQEIGEEVTLNIKQESGISAEYSEEPKSLTPFKDDATVVDSSPSPLQTPSTSNLSKTKSKSKPSTPTKIKSRSPRKSNPMTIKFNFKKSSSLTNVTDSVKGSKSTKVTGSAKSTKVTGLSKSTKVTGPAKSAKITASSKLSKLTGSAKSTKVTASSKSNKVTGSPKPNKVTGSAKSIKVTGSAKSTKVTSSSKSSNVTGSSKSTKVTISAQSPKVTGSAKSSKITGSAKSSKVTDLANATKVTGSAEVTNFINVTDSAKKEPPVTKPIKVIDSLGSTKPIKVIDSLGSTDSFDSIGSVISVDSDVSSHSFESPAVTDPAKVTKTNTVIESFDSIDSFDSVFSVDSFDSINSVNLDDSPYSIDSSAATDAAKTAKVITVIDSLDSDDSSEVTNQTKATVSGSNILDDDILLNVEPEQKMFECKQCSAKFYSLFQMQNHQSFLHRGDMKSSTLKTEMIFGQSPKKGPKKNNAIDQTKACSGTVSSMSTIDACSSRSSTKVKSTSSATSLPKSKPGPRSSKLKDAQSMSRSKPKVTSARVNSEDGSDVSSGSTPRSDTEPGPSRTSSKADTTVRTKSGKLKRASSSASISEPPAKRAMTHKLRCSYCEKGCNSLMTLGKHFSLEHTDKGEVLWIDVESGCTFNRTGCHSTVSATCSHPLKYLCYCCDYRARTRDIVKEHQKEQHGRNKQIIKLSETDKDMYDIKTKKAKR